MTAEFSTQIEVDARGMAWLAGTRTKVAEIVLDKIAYGWSPEEICFQHSRLSLAQVYAALTWYYENQAHVDAQIRERMNGAGLLAEKASDPEFRRKMIERKHAL